MMNSLFKIAICSLAILTPMQSFAKSDSSFEGCAGSKIMKNNGGSSADIRAELKESEKRINKICKDLSGRMNRIREYSAKCGKGAAPENMRQMDNASVDIQGFSSNIDHACKALKQDMEVSKDYCSYRKFHLEQVEKNIKNSISDAPERAQADLYTKQYQNYNTAQISMSRMSEKANEASDKIYDSLPDRDTDRSDSKKGEEKSETKDPKLDAIVESLKRTHTQLAIKNKNPTYCKKLASENGELEKTADILKQNLWPNGKRAARSIRVMGDQDKFMASKYQQLAAQSQKSAVALGAQDPALKTAAEQKKQQQAFDPDAGKRNRGSYNTLEGGQRLPDGTIQSSGEKITMEQNGSTMLTSQCDTAAGTCLNVKGQTVVMPKSVTGDLTADTAPAPVAPAPVAPVKQVVEKTGSQSAIASALEAQDSAPALEQSQPTSQESQTAPALVEEAKPPAKQPCYTGYFDFGEPDGMGYPDANGYCQ